MGNWNPNEPTLVGQEWLPPTAATEGLYTSTAAAALQFTSTAIETIDRINFYVDGFTDPNQANALIEVMESGNELVGATTTDTYRPNEDSPGVTNIVNEAAAAVNLYQSIDEATLDLTDYLVNTAMPTAGHYTMKLGTAAFGASRRVTDVRIVIVGEQILGTTTWNIELRQQGEGFLTLWREAKTVGQGRFTETISIGELNPFTGLPWTQTEIASFDDTVAADRLSITWRMNGMSTIYDGGYLYQLYMEVDWVTENRVAVGRGTINADGWITIAVRDPDSGADNWSKIVDDYTVQVRRVDGVGTPGTSSGGPLNPATGGFGVRYMLASTERGEGGLPVAGMASYEPSLATDGTITALGTAGERGYALILRTTAPATSADGQPYAEQVAALVSTSSTARQKITPTVTAVAEQVRFLLRYDADASPTGSLVVTIKIHSSGVQVGGTATLTPSAFGAGSDTYRIVTVDLSSTAALTALTQYRIEFTSTTAAANPWYVLAGDGVIATYGIASYGGVTDDADVNGAGYDDDVDVFVHVIDPGPGPLDTTTTVVTDPNAAAFDGCAVDEIDTSYMTWVWPTVSADAYMEIERKDEDDWELIAQITDQETVEFTDYEARRTHPNYICACYRMRIIDLVPSNWTPQTGCGGTGLVSDSGAGAPGPLGDFANTDSPWLAFGTWERTGSDFKIAGAAGAERFALFDTGKTDTTFRATVGTVRQTGWGIVGVFVDTSNHVRAWLNTGTNQWVIEQVLAGVVTTIGGPTAGATSTGTSARLTFSGGSVTLLISEVALIGPVAYDASLVSPLVGMFADNAVTDVSRWAAATTTLSTTCVTLESYGCELIFATNSGGSYAWEDIHTGPQSERGYDLLDSSQVKFWRVYGRDTQIGLQPSERDGDTFTRTLAVWGGDTAPTEPGRAVFDALENWVRRDFPYLAVLDSHGRRWLALVQLPSVINREPGYTYLANVQITEIATVPAVVVR